jgi:hypothetical protein
MAYNFTAASSQYLSTASTPVTSMPLTIAAWFNSNVSTAQRVIAQIGNTALAGGEVYRLVIPSGAQVLRAISLSGGGFGGATTSVQAETASGTVSNQVWNHGAGVFESTTSRTVYLNHSTSASNTTSYSPPTVANIHIGANLTNNTSAAATWSGLLAEVGVWSAALTADEIKSLSAGMTCDKVRPQSLVFYAPLIRDLQDVRGGLTIANNNSATVANHPRVYA